ncbi:GNAT family N-acetyltransferase [Streptomyces sp. NPDC002206]
MSGPARLPVVHFERVTADTPAGRQAVLVREHRERVVGQLEYQVCHPCRLGYIDRISVVGCRQGHGLGREALHTALAPCPGYAWSTSRQSSVGRKFFLAMAEETDISFPPRGVRCPHMVSANSPSGATGTSDGQ